MLIKSLLELLRFLAKSYDGLLGFEFGVPIKATRALIILTVLVTPLLSDVVGCGVVVFDNVLAFNERLLYHLRLNEVVNLSVGGCRAYYFFQICHYFESLVYVSFTVAINPKRKSYHVTTSSLLKYSS